MKLPKIDINKLLRKYWFEGMCYILAAYMFYNFVMLIVRV
jgi:hypothetical protein